MARRKLVLAGVAASPLLSSIREEAAIPSLDVAAEQTVMIAGQ